MQMHVEEKSWPLRSPFQITGHTFHAVEAVWVTLTDDNVVGRGEAVGVYYHGDTPGSMRDELEAVKAHVEEGATRLDLLDLLPAGGARNALDCAMWDLECKREGVTIWEKLQMEPRELVTVATVGLGSPEDMAKRATEFSPYPHLKIKLDGDRPRERLRAIREARPDATLVVDVNQGWTLPQLEALLPDLVDLSIAFLEQPLPAGEDQGLEGFGSPIPLGADESFQGRADYEAVRGRYDVLNIKLDKCGGLTEALAIIEQARPDGMDLMVGNMTGTSLGMAPAHVVGQWCRFVDIDGPLLMCEDITPGLSYLPGGIVPPPTPHLWG